LWRFVVERNRVTQRPAVDEIQSWSNGSFDLNLPGADAPDAHLRKAPCPLPHRSGGKISSFQTVRRTSASGQRELNRESEFFSLGLGNEFGS
jgi:hypothetical protein